MTARATTGAFVALLALTAATAALSTVRLGGLEAPVALGIGGVKALLVAAVFVELAVDRFGHRLALGVAALLAAILVALATADVVTRP